MPSTAQLKHALSDLVAAEARRTPNHPSPEQLASYTEGLLETEEAEVLRDHLVHCSTCREEVGSLARFVQIAERDEDPEERPQPEVEAALSKLRQRIQSHELEIAAQPLAAPSNTAQPLAEVKPFPGATGASPRAVARSWGSPRTAQLLAAGLALAVVGLGGSSLYFRNEARDLAAAAVNPPRVVLKPLKVVRSEGGPEAAAVRGDSRRFLVAFDSDRLSTLPSRVPVELCATFEGAGLAAAQRICGELIRGPGDRFSIALTRDEFPAGTYSVKLAKTQPPPEELLEQYTLTIQ